MWRPRIRAVCQWLRAKPSFPLWCSLSAFLPHLSCHLMGSLSQIWNWSLLWGQILLSIICWKPLGRMKSLERIYYTATKGTLPLDRHALRKGICLHQSINPIRLKAISSTIYTYFFLIEEKLRLLGALKRQRNSLKWAEIGLSISSFNVTYSISNDGVPLGHTAPNIVCGNL